MGEKPSVYLETTICSYLAAWPMGQLVAAARQRLVNEWRRTQPDQYDVFVSEIVIIEASRGDQDAVRRRLEIIERLEVLPLSDLAIDLADRIELTSGLPSRAAADALHIAIAAVEGMDFLVTLNMKHIANAHFRKGISDACRNFGFEPPQICTPDELLGGLPEDENDG